MQEYQIKGTISTYIVQNPVVIYKKNAEVITKAELNESNKQKKIIISNVSNKK